MFTHTPNKVNERVNFIFAVCVYLSVLSVCLCMCVCGWEGDRTEEMFKRGRDCSDEQLSLRVQWGLSEPSEQAYQ